MATWSHSRLESFRNCPRQYFYRYVARVKLPEEPETIEQFLGSRAHDALEWLYGEVQKGRTPDTAALLDAFRADWDAQWHDGVVSPADGRTPLEQREEAAHWLAAYHAAHAPFAGPRIVGLEQRIGFALDEAAGIRMTGFIDRLEAEPDGTWRIHDYKTNRRLPTQQDKDADPQLAYYEIGIRTMWPEQVKRVELTWHFLKFGVAITSRRTPEQLAALRGEALATIADAEARPPRAEAFPTNESRLCDWCGFQSVCPVRKHRFAVAGLPEKRFANESGVKLVDRWTALDEKRAALKAEIDALEAEIEEVREALAAYAEKHGLEVVAGAEREATVKRGEAVGFPRKSVTEEAESAEALEAQLRASPWWGEASSLDRYALKRLWDRRGELDADLRALLEEHARLEATLDVRLRKPKRR